MLSYLWVFQVSSTKLDKERSEDIAEEVRDSEKMVGSMTLWSWVSQRSDVKTMFRVVLIFVILFS